MSGECEDYWDLCQNSLKHTTTVSELIEILSKHPGDMKVVTTWEDTVRPIGEKDVYMSIHGFLYIDAEGQGK